MRAQILKKRAWLSLLSCRGEMYIDTMVSVLIILLVLAMVLSFFPVFMQKYQLEMAAEDIARMISVCGETDTVDIERIAQDYNISLDSYDVVIDTDARTIPSGAGMKIQLSDGFKVVLSTHRTVGIGGVLNSIDIGLGSVARGRSEVYWKEIALAS